MKEREMVLNAASGAVFVRLKIFSFINRRVNIVAHAAHMAGFAEFSAGGEVLISNLVISERISGTDLVKQTWGFDVFTVCIYWSFVMQFDHQLMKNGNVNSVVRKKLQLVRSGCYVYWRANTRKFQVPVVDDLVFNFRLKLIQRKEVLEMERLMLNTLQFNMSVPTPLCFHEKIPRLLSQIESGIRNAQVSTVLSHCCCNMYCTIYTLWRRPVEQDVRVAYWILRRSTARMLETDRRVSRQGRNRKTDRGSQKSIHTSKYGYAARCETCTFLVQIPPPIGREHVQFY
ncbi:Cyclin-B2-2 [Sesamum angolense]|uniref:Cyclin-B2-2 n=1 Tax=Sesamum angolense TaxID=2727404 RepID=A0AAE1T7R4_9LAMI|nr:Cyclin-B2-2 [Sesamum angolense]